MSIALPQRIRKKRNFSNEKKYFNKYIRDEIIEKNKKNNDLEINEYIFSLY